LRPANKPRTGCSCSLNKCQVPVPPPDPPKLSQAARPCPLPHLTSNHYRLPHALLPRCSSHVLASSPLVATGCSCGTNRYGCIRRYWSYSSRLRCSSFIRTCPASIVTIFSLHGSNCTNILDGRCIDSLSRACSRSVSRYDTCKCPNEVRPVMISKRRPAANTGLG
jgi:hypothetical protein